MAYELSKIYMIVSDLGTLKYIGSTKKKYLSSRLAGHIYDYFKFKKGLRPPISSFKLFDEYGIENCSIVLIENFSCQNKIELKERERHYIQTMECVNIQIPLRTKQEYREQNREKINEHNKEYRSENKEKINEYNKEYRLKNKDKMREWQLNNKDKIKEYRLKNKDKIKEYNKKYRLSKKSTPST